MKQVDKLRDDKERSMWLQIDPLASYGHREKTAGGSEVLFKLSTDYSCLGVEMEIFVFAFF